VGTDTFIGIDGHEARKEAATRDGVARVHEVSLDDAMVLRVEMEMEFISNGGHDSVGFESEVTIANININNCSVDS